MQSTWTIEVAIRRTSETPSVSACDLLNHQEWRMPPAYGEAEHTLHWNALIFDGASLDGACQWAGLSYRAPCYHPRRLSSLAIAHWKSSHSWRASTLPSLDHSFGAYATTTRPWPFSENILKCACPVVLLLAILRDKLPSFLCLVSTWMTCGQSKSEISSYKPDCSDPCCFLCNIFTKLCVTNRLRCCNSLNKNQVIWQQCKRPLGIVVKYYSPDDLQ